MKYLLTLTLSLFALQAFAIHNGQSAEVKPYKIMEYTSTDYNTCIMVYKDLSEEPRHACTRDKSDTHAIRSLNKLNLVGLSIGDVAPRMGFSITALLEAIQENNNVEEFEKSDRETQLLEEIDRLKGLIKTLQDGEEQTTAKCNNSNKRRCRIKTNKNSTRNESPYRPIPRLYIWDR